MCARVMCVQKMENYPGWSTLAPQGERKLLPTNGMRACTAAIVELSFNAAAVMPGAGRPNQVLTLSG